MTAEEAGGLLGLSMRHVRRILAAYRKEGAAALAHGNRGKKPQHALDEELKKQVLELAQSTYAGCNNQHFTELLAEREGINLSRSTVRRILLGAGIRSPRKRRPPKHRSRRERYPKEGTLPQGGNATPRRECYYKLTAARMIGWKGEDLISPL